MSDWKIIEVRRRGRDSSGMFVFFYVRWTDSRGYYQHRVFDLPAKGDPTELHAILHAQKQYIEPHEWWIQTL